jgi:hypothetical protein
LTMPSQASSMATRTLPSPTSLTPASLLPATSSYLTEAPSRGDLPRPRYKPSTPPKRGRKQHTSATATKPITAPTRPVTSTTQTEKEVPTSSLRVVMGLMKPKASRGKWMRRRQNVWV